MCQWRATGLQSLVDELFFIFFFRWRTFPEGCWMHILDWDFLSARGIQASRDNGIPIEGSPWTPSVSYCQDARGGFRCSYELGSHEAERRHRTPDRCSFFDFVSFFCIFFSEYVWNILVSSLNQFFMFFSFLIFGIYIKVLRMIWNIWTKTLISSLVLESK